MFTGLLVNRETLHPLLQWFHTFSFFHAAFEALAVNELRYLQLKQKSVSHFNLFSGLSRLQTLFILQFSVDLDVPAATILSMFGLRAGVSDVRPSDALSIADLALRIAVILVAKRRTLRHILRNVHIHQLPYSPLLCQGEAIAFIVWSIYPFSFLASPTLYMEPGCLCDTSCTWTCLCLYDLFVLNIVLFSRSLHTQQNDLPSARPFAV